MRYVILRDDDTNAFTPAGHLDRLYRPFLDLGLPVNLAVIPWVRTDSKTLAGEPEGFLHGNYAPTPKAVPVGQNEELVRYLRENPGYHIAQHGCHHEPAEFDTRDREEIARRLSQGASMLSSAGLGTPAAFVAPHDRLSAAGFEEIARRYRVISTGWFEWRRVPVRWRLLYLLHKLRKARHWRVGRTFLLGHPGCLLSCRRRLDAMLENVQRAVLGGSLTVLVTHWWEYFHNGSPDEAFVAVLHQTAAWLASEPDIQVISFGELLRHDFPLNAPSPRLTGGGGQRRRALPRTIPSA